MYDQNRMEREELEVVEGEEMLSAEASNLLSELNSEIAYGEVLGVFTPKEAMEWYAGADACTKTAHLRGLLGYIGKFIASGEARLQKLAQAVDNDLLTASEQRGYLSEAHGSTYQAKGRLIEEVRSLLRELRSVESQLTSILNRKNIPASAKGGLINKFYSASSNSKSSVVKEAETISVVEERPGATSEKINAGNIEFEPKTGELPAAIKKDPKRDCLELAERYMERGQFSRAADLVEASNRYFNLVEYRGLLKRIDKARLAKEIPELQTGLKAA